MYRSQPDICKLSRAGSSLMDWPMLNAGYVSWVELNCIMCWLDYLIPKKKKITETFNLYTTQDNLTHFTWPEPFAHLDLEVSNGPKLLRQGTARMHTERHYPGVADSANLSYFV